MLTEDESNAALSPQNSKQETNAPPMKEIKPLKIEGNINPTDYQTPED